MFNCFEDVKDVEECFEGLRLDQVAARMWPEFSREQIKGWLQLGCIQLNGQSSKPSIRVHQGDQIEIDVVMEDRTHAEPEPMALKIVHEDMHILVIDKPAGLVVHPGAGHWSGTLVNGLVHLDPALAALPRAGLVHRLDKDTSGLLVVARTAQAQESLINQLKLRSVRRHYKAIALGCVPIRGEVDAPIGRHPRDRVRMAVVSQGKPALTYYQRLAFANSCSLLDVQLATGRTHQIRVHMAHAGYPLLADPVYAPVMNEMHQAYQAQLLMKRQALHAWQLGLIHPCSGQAMVWQAELPRDFHDAACCLFGDIF